MKTKLLFAALISCTILTSCATINQYSSLPYVGLNSGNFEYVRNVSASVSATYFLGLGGLNKADLNVELRNKANLQSGEALVNVSYHNEYTWCAPFGYVNITTTATAQVIRFTSPERVSEESPE